MGVKYTVAVGDIAQNPPSTNATDNKHDTHSTVHT